MSQENVEIVLAMQPSPDADIAALLRDDKQWKAAANAAAPLIHPNFECTLPLFGKAESHAGMDGLRVAWLDWTAPWATYRTVVEEAIDLGERVLLLLRDYGRRKATDPEVEQMDAAVWTVRENKLARAEFYADRQQALKAVGLEE